MTYLLASMTRRATAAIERVCWLPSWGDSISLDSGCLGLEQQRVMQDTVETSCPLEC